MSRLAHAMKESAAQVGAESVPAPLLALERDAMSLDDDAPVRVIP